MKTVGLEPLVGLDAAARAAVARQAERRLNALGLSPSVLLQRLVDAFLAWPLPDSVCSDGCVTERGAPHRTGTNLLTADEARQMFEHALGAAGLLGPKCTICNDTGWNHGAQPGPGPGYKTVRCSCGATPNAKVSGGGAFPPSA